MTPVPQQQSSGACADAKPLVVITGASGLIGSRVARALDGDYRVVGLDIKPPDDDATPMEFIEADLTDANSLSRALRQLKTEQGDRIASVVHLAAYYDFSGEPSPLYDELTVEGTRRLLTALRDFDVEQFIFSSSLLVMEPCEVGEYLTETSPTCAEWAYPESKLRAEEVISTTHDEIPTVILRISGIYDDQCHSIPLARQIARIYEKQAESFVFPGDSAAGSPFLHVADLAACVRRLIEKRGELDETELFLVAEPHVLSYAELQDQLGMLLHGTEWPSIRVPKAVAKAGAWAKAKLAGSEGEQPFIKPWMVDLADDHYAVDISRIKHRLGWQPQRRLEDTLKQMTAHLTADPPRWYAEHGLPIPDSLAAEQCRS